VEDNLVVVGQDIAEAGLVVDIVDYLGNSVVLVDIVDQDIAGEEIAEGFVVDIVEERFVAEDNSAFVAQGIEEVPVVDIEEAFLVGQGIVEEGIVGEAFLGDIGQDIQKDYCYTFLSDF